MSARLKLKKIHNLLNGALKLASQAETDLLILKRKFCWNGLEVPVERDVSAVALCRFGFVAVTFDGEMFSHCATIGKSIELKEVK